MMRHRDRIEEVDARTLRFKFRTGHRVEVGGERIELPPPD